MQIMFGTILCVLLKSLVLTKAIITPNDYITSKTLQKESVSMCPDLNTQDISMPEKSNHHVLNFKSDWSHSDSTVRNEREVDEVTLANISIIPSIGNSLNKPTSLRAFVQFDSQFTKNVNDIFVTLRWNQSELTDEIIQGYTVQCFFIEDLQEIQICDDKNITTTTLEHTVHNLKPNMTYYFRVRAHTEVIAGPYTDFINVTTTHENPIPKLLLLTDTGIHILDLDSNTINNLVEQSDIRDVAYLAHEHKIYWMHGNNLMTLDITENNITKIASFNFKLYKIYLCIDWIARNLYITYYDEENYYYIVKFDITMWENGIIKFDEISQAKKSTLDYLIDYLISPSMGILYRISYNRQNKESNIMKYHLDGKNGQIFQINASSCQFYYEYYEHYIIDNMNNEEPLIYWLTTDYIVVTNTNFSMCNTILHRQNISDNSFISMTTDKTNIYILAYKLFTFHIYVSKKKYASLKSVNVDEYVEKTIINLDDYFLREIYAFDKSSQPYPQMRCLTPYKKIYNFENVTATTNSIIVNLPEPVVKNGCKKYNLPTTIYTISVSCLDNNLNKSEKFHVQTYERYYEIQNLIPFTEYKLKFTLSNFYFDQLSLNPFDSNMTSMKTNPGKLNAPENISVLALTPTITVVHWMPPKNVKCEAVTYEVHWKSVILVDGTQQKSKQFINMPKRMADGRFFTKINLSLLVQDYLIYVRVYPVNFSDFYNESLSKIVHIYSEPNNITLSGASINSMNISNINLTVSSTLEYKDIATEKWQTTNYIKMNYNEEVIYHIENLQSGTSYQFRLILIYREYEENFTWPADERFIFSTRGSKRGDILNTSGILARKYCLLLLLSFIIIFIVICACCFYNLYRQHRNNTEHILPSIMTDTELAVFPGVAQDVGHRRK